MGDMQTGRTKQPKGTRRTRLGRCSISGQIYHVIAATHDRVTHFSDFTRGRFVVKALMRVRSERIAATLAYVVMPDHLHWLMQLRGRMDLSSCVGNIKSYSARMLNEFTKSSGAVWQRGFFDNAIRSDGDLVALSRYIVANPLRAGLVEFIGDYPLWDAVWMHPSRSKERSNNRNPLRSNESKNPSRSKERSNNRNPLRSNESKHPSRSKERSNNRNPLRSNK